MLHKSAQRECPTRVSHKSVKHCLAVCFQVPVCIRVRGFHLVFSHCNCSCYILLHFRSASQKSCAVVLCSAKVGAERWLKSQTWRRPQLWRGLRGPIFGRWDCSACLAATAAGCTMIHTSHVIMLPCFAGLFCQLCFPWKSLLMKAHDSFR